MDVNRVDYLSEGLDESTLAPTPWQQAKRWVDEVLAQPIEGEPRFEPLAMSVATVDADLVPNVRTVLMRFFDERGPGFVSSTHSTKAAELAVHPHLAAALTWPSRFRAIRFRGRAQPIAADELTAYWRTRPWASRISAAASKQSQPVASRAELEAEVARLAALYPDTGSPDDVLEPPDWCGWRVDCDEVEFWAGRVDRLHDRLVFSRVGPGGLDDEAAWRVFRRQP